MTNELVIILCALLLIAYLFDLSSSVTRIPSVILLLVLGWLVRQVTDLTGIKVTDLSPLLPALGTIGLILIVLEGSLELEFNRSRAPLIGKSIVGSLFSLFALSLLIAWAFSYFGGVSFRTGLINAIPLCIISSAIAIPSVKFLPPHKKEFIIYESSLSDIFGVLFFNFIVINEVINWGALGSFSLQLFAMTLISVIATILLAFILSKISDHIKFVPIILFIILIYFISKIYHLPGLILVLIFGLVIGNVDELRDFKWFRVFKPDVLTPEVEKFKELTKEAAFLIRTLFFLLFGFLLNTAELLNTETALWSAGIVLLIFALRFIQLKVSGLKLSPLLFIAPRGLITILLFLSIPATEAIGLLNRSVVIQVIIFSAVLMMIGLIFTGEWEVRPNKRKKESQADLPDVEG